MAPYLYMPIETPGVKWHKITDLILVLRIIPGAVPVSRHAAQLNALEGLTCESMRPHLGVVKVENGYKHGSLTPLTWDIT